MEEGAGAAGKRSAECHKVGEGDAGRDGVRDAREENIEERTY